MALRAGYYGLKRSIKNKLSILAESMPADISPDNPIAGKNDVLASIGLINDTVGWVGKNRLNAKFKNTDTPDIVVTPHYNAAGLLEYVNLNGSNTSGEKILIQFAARLDGDLILPIGKYKFSLGASNENIKMQVGRNSNGPTSGSFVLLATSNYGDRDLSFTQDQPYGLTVQIFANANSTFDNVKVYPMICTAEQYALNPVYDPYHDSVAEMLDGKMSKGRLLTSADDLNNITETGIYSFSTSPANAPEGVVYGTLIVEGNATGSTGVRQIIFVSGTSSAIIYTRGYVGSPQTWKSWFKFTGTELTPASLTKEDETKKATKKKVIKEEE